MIGSDESAGSVRGNILVCEVLTVGENPAANRACKNRLISTVEFFFVVVAGDPEVAVCYFIDRCFYICCRIIKHTLCATYIKSLTESL